MIYLAFSILLSTSLLITFKAFKVLNLDTLMAIVINYLVCALVGIVNILITKNLIRLTESIWQQEWLWFSVVLGLIFVSVFYVMAITTQKLGVTVTAIANKLSLVIPVIFAFIYYKDSMGWMKLVGIALALIAIYASSWKPADQNKQHSKRSWLLIALPLIVFLGSGIVDTSIKFAQDRYLSEGMIHIFLAFLFSAAFLFGIIFLLLRKGGFNLSEFKGRTLIGSIILGLPNYGSIYFLVKTLELDGLQSSTIYSINNISIVCLSAIAAYFIYREKLNKFNLAGLGLALAAILMIALS